MSCNHLYDCLRCGSEVESLEIEVESLEQRIEELEEWIAGIADDHQQIPDWIQQNARSLLAQEGE